MLEEAGESTIERWFRDCSVESLVVGYPGVVRIFRLLEEERVQFISHSLDNQSLLRGSRSLPASGKSRNENSLGRLPLVRKLPVVDDSSPEISCKHSSYYDYPCFGMELNRPAYYPRKSIQLRQTTPIFLSSNVFISLVLSLVFLLL